eukprot:TRINITY_DN571_c0_g1_i6.p1 TRINITY_DN571_c0_g1~~TRINITY_DN571_c0_g1_i6.p1  ORF type:complete len:500 (+),score=187.19 TRINITY_DN571_c0_g1_i6:58-1557(+)
MGKGRMDVDVIRVVGRAAVQEEAPKVRDCGVCGICVGALLVLVSLGLLGWNEKRAVYTARTIGSARDTFVQLDSCTPDSANDGKLVALTGCGPLPDTSFQPNYLTGVASQSGISSPLTSSGAPVFAWSRLAEERVKVEHKEELRHADNTTYIVFTYVQEWTTSKVKYENPKRLSPLARPQSWGAKYDEHASLVCLGANDSCTAGQKNAFVLSAGDSFGQHHIRNMGVRQPLKLARGAVVKTNIRNDLGTYAVARYCSGALQTNMRGLRSTRCSAEAATPAHHGDFRFTWTQRVLTQGYVVSGLAQQVRNADGTTTLAEWQNPKFSDCSYCEIGTITSGSVTGEELLARLETSNKVMTWVFRAVGFLLCWFALHLIVSPMARVPETIPGVGECLSDLLGMLLVCVTCVMAAALSCLAIAGMWVMMRPLIAVPLLLVTVGGIAGVVVFLCRRRKRAVETVGLTDADADSQLDDLEGGDAAHVFPMSVNAVDSPSPLSASRV